MNKETWHKIWPIIRFIAIAAPIIVILTFFLIFPMLLGALAITLDHEALTGLIIASIALGTVTLWLTTNPSKARKIKANTRQLKVIGKFFLYAALLFSMSMLLSPVVPPTGPPPSYYENTLKWAYIIGLMAGSSLFSVATILSLLSLWKV